MFGGLLPRDGNFFQLFERHAEQLVLGATQLNALFDDFAAVQMHARNVETCEKQADRITHETVEMLHKTFITPLDREDIHSLITRMDDILDLMEDVAQSVFLYDVRAVSDEAKKLAQLCLLCTEKVKAAVGQLSNMDNAQQILKICGEIDRYEAEADHIMRAAMAKLFREEKDTRELIKMKEIYELLETVTDRCEDVANIIEGIVLENV